MDGSEKSPCRILMSRKALVADRNRAERQLSGSFERPS
jgi:hypothetical protein